MGNILGKIAYNNIVKTAKRVTSEPRLKTLLEEGRNAA